MSDEFAWIKEKSNPKVLELLRAENLRTEETLSDASTVADEIYREILARTKESDSQVPYRMGEYEYFSRTEAGREYPIHMRRRIGTDATQVVLDLNPLAEGHEFLSLGEFSISPDGSKIAYSLDTTGAEVYSIFVRDLATDSPPRLEVDGKSDGSVEWSLDQTGLFYLTLDETHRPYRLHRHDLGGAVSEDPVLFTEDDPRFYVGISVSKDDSVLFIESESKDTSEAYFLRMGVQKDPAPVRIRQRRKGILYEPYHFFDRMLIVTNDQAEDFRIMEASYAPDPPWKEWIPYDEERRIEDLEIFDGHVAIFERRGGLKNLRIVSLPDREIHDLHFADAAYTLEADHNEELRTSRVRFIYQSPVTPPTTYAYDMDTRAFETLKTTEIPCGFRKEDYQLEYLSAPARDGTQVPITLLTRTGTARNGSAPLFLNGYGAYEISKEPVFKRSWFSLLDRGFAVAIAHIRGGGELGRGWYENGKLLKKTNSFTDFIDCAEHLSRIGVAAKGKISIMGGSAGGLLMGAVTNLRPDLWNAVLALVPFVDVFNTMSDPSLPLTVTEYDEWGNPGEEPYRTYILGYSPYENVREARYPAILATAGLNDPRVGYWEPAKWVLRLRQFNRGDRPILLKTDLESGHGGPSGRYDKIKEEAFCLAFIVRQST